MSGSPIEKKASMASMTGGMHRSASASNMGGNHTPTSPYPVRLMKLSSAQPLLSTTAKPGQKMLHRLALIIQESAATPQESTKGKLPVEAAYVVMKKVTEHAGAPIMPVGMSTFNKLESLRTDPAITVLKQQTWKDFFTSQRPNSPSNTMRMSGQMKSQTSFANKFQETPETGAEKGQDGPTLLDVIIDTLISRVETLWDELKIAEKERKFYRKTLCKFPAISIDQARDLSIYIDALQQHKAATKSVLFAIQTREKAVKRCYDVLIALNRKYARILSAQRDNMSLSASLRPSSAPATPLLSKTNKLETGPVSLGVQAFWKEELVMALDEVRCCSLDVIKAIQHWRRNMWRPHAFIYKEQNYLLKMMNDMSVLESDIYQRLLNFLPLELHQLVGVVFNRELIEQLSARGLSIPNEDQHVEGEDPSEDAVRTMIREFVVNIEAEELEVAAKVVLQEEVLQRALHTEQVSLVSKGVFIPLLKVKFVAEPEEQGDFN